MIILNITPSNASNGTPIHFSVELNTNNGLLYKNNSIDVITPGLYEIIGEATLESSDGVSTGLMIYADNNIVGDAATFKASASGEIQTVPLYAVINAKATNVNTHVNVDIMPVGSPVIVGGTFSMKLIK